MPETLHKSPEFADVCTPGGSSGELEAGFTGRWLQIELYARTKATSIWLVRSTIYEQGELGRIKWYGPWRCYAFFPNPGTLFEPSCLEDLAGFLDRVTRAQRATWKRRAT